MGWYNTICSWQISTLRNTFVVCFALTQSQQLCNQPCTFSGWEILAIIPHLQLMCQDWKYPSCTFKNLENVIVPWKAQPLNSDAIWAVRVEWLWLNAEQCQHLLNGYLGRLLSLWKWDDSQAFLKSARIITPFRVTECAMCRQWKSSL